MAGDAAREYRRSRRGNPGRRAIHARAELGADRQPVTGRQGRRGPPFLIVEILSPSDPDYDRRIKAQRYAALGVPHYWIADPDAKTLECYRNEGGRYVLCVSGRAPDSLTHPDFPDLTIPLPSIWPA
jgi:Uma2 family endonuclease